MIVRESPKKATRPAQNWPPKSPHEALLSSPSGRKKLEARGRDVSPSPVKRNSSRRNLDIATNISLDGSYDDDDNDDDDEDEETLKLKLQAIEARLKLKKLQKAKDKAPDSPATTTKLRRSPSKVNPPERLRATRLEDSRRTPEFQVPVSPVRRRTPPPQTSPARVILGIDKGLRAQDVSLKRSPHRARLNGSSSGPLSKATSSLASSTRTGLGTAPIPQVKSFSERLAESKAQDKHHQERESRNLKARSSGFGFKKPDISAPQTRTLPLSPKKSARTLGQAKSLQDLAAERKIPSSNSTPLPRPSSVYRESSPSKNAEGDDSSFDSYSGFHLSKRQIPHTDLSRTLAEKEIYPLPRLLKTVHAPTYDPPDVEGDYVVVGIIAAKSMPRDHKDTVKVSSGGDADGRSQPQRTKFMVIKLTDLKWDVDLFLFGSGFEAFWKMTPGTVVAILNPGIMPPRNKDSGAFSLKLTSSDDTVLEVGTARDLGFCSAIKKDGKECGQWIDGRKTECCEFHLAIQLDKTKAGRMEVNTMSGFGRTKDSKWRYASGGADRRANIRSHDVKLKALDGPPGRNYDRESHSQYYVVPGAGSTATLLDEDADHNAFDRGMNRGELHRRRLAEKEKEKELGSKLAQLGSSMGSEYLRSRQSDLGSSITSGPRLLDSSPSGQDLPPARDAISLGLLNRKASEVSLYAANKRKRPATGSSTSSQPMGWSGAFKRGLLDSVKPPDAEKPQQKKTRLFLDGKGIRTPGRESLPNVNISNDDDDDDELDIILEP